MKGRLRRWAIGLMLAGGLLTGCGGGSAEDGAQSGQGGTQPQVAPGLWVVLGSSSAAGLGAPAGQSWVERMTQEVAMRGVQVHNLARIGAFSSQALPVSAGVSGRQLPPDAAIGIERALALSPRLLLLSFPSNDTAAGFTADETVANLTVLHRLATSAGVATMILGTQPRSTLGASQRATLAEIDRRLSRLAQHCFVPLQAVLGDGAGQWNPGLTLADGVHLNAAGHAAVWEQVQSVLDSGRCVARSVQD